MTNVVSDIPRAANAAKYISHLSIVQQSIDFSGSVSDVFVFNALRVICKFMWETRITKSVTIILKRKIIAIFSCFFGANVWLAILKVIQSADEQEKLDVTR